MSLGIRGNPQREDKVLIKLNNGNEIEGIVVKWGVDLWGQCWAMLKVNEKIVQLNISSILYFSLDKNEFINRSKCDPMEAKRLEEIAKKKFVKEKKKPILVKRNMKESSFEEEADGAFKQLYLDPIERAKLLTKQNAEKEKMLRKSIQEHMVKKDVERVKNNYAMPSFKNYSKD